MTPSDHVRERRVEVLGQMRTGHAGGERNNAFCKQMLDAYAAAIRAECDAEIAALRADGERLDWLEGEEQREADANRLGTSPYPRSLFRENMPITRESIDAARASETRGSNG